MRFLWLPLCALLAPAQQFNESVYPVLEKAACRACHTEEGVASATRLQFPPSSATPAQIKDFGRSLVEFVNTTDPTLSPLWRTPTGRMDHAGGLRIPAATTGDKTL